MIITNQKSTRGETETRLLSECLRSSLLFIRLKELGQLENMKIMGKAGDYRKGRDYVLVDKR